MRIALFRIALATTTLSCATIAFAQLSGPSKHRVVSDGVANCIFSTQVLPYQQDNAAGYRLAKSNFATNEPVYARCYFPADLVKYESLGRSYNTMRSNQTYNLDLVAVEPGTGKEILISGIGGSYDRPTRNQVRLDIIRSGDCDMTLDGAQASRWKISVRKKTKPSKFCPDLQKITAALQRKYGGSPIQYCLRAFVPFADETQTIRTYHRGEVQYQKRPKNVQRKTIAQGCFTYDSI